jgi:hypothetical protein
VPDLLSFTPDLPNFATQPIEVGIDHAFGYPDEPGVIERFRPGECQVRFEAEWNDEAGDWIFGKRVDDAWSIRPPVIGDNARTVARRAAPFILRTLINNAFSIAFRADFFSHRYAAPSPAAAQSSGRFARSPALGADRPIKQIGPQTFCRD